MPRSSTSEQERLRGVALGRSIQEARRKVKKSAERVAVDADVPVDTLRRIEQGRIANPGFFTVTAIAREVKARVQTLVEESQPKAKRQ
jgi:transcriptional regulator with XRE-family HTH domain